MADWEPKRNSEGEIVQQIDYLRNTYPGMSKKCDYERSRRAAIRLFCLECTGGSTSYIENCPSTGCFLWQFRRGTAKFTDEEREARAEVIPPKEWYDEKLASYGTKGEEDE